MAINNSMELRIKLNDGGKSLSRRPKQKNPCTVIATAIAFDMSFDEAFDMMQIHGRQSNRGMPYISFLKQYPQYAQQMKEIGYCMCNVAEVMRYLQDGKYLVLVDSHVFAVIDGVIHDRVPVNCYDEVYYVWKVIKPMSVADTLADAL